MLVCPTCDRHVLAHASSCPFCGRALATTRAVTMTSIVLGLALVGCGDKMTNDDAADSTMNDSMTSTTGTGTDSVSETWGEEVSAYADPSDSWWTTDDDGPGDDSTDSTDDTGTTGTGTDTGDTDTDTDTDGTGDSSTGDDSTGENDSNGD